MAEDAIYLGFSTTNIWLSKLIRRATGARYSHCWVRHGSDVWGGEWITQADWPVVRTWPWKVATRGWTVRTMYRPRFDIHPALAAVRKDFEERYDVIGLFGMVAVVLALKWFKRRIKNPFAQPKAVFCSEFVAEILVAAHLPGTGDWDTQALTPKDVEAYCRAHPELFDRIDSGPQVVPLEKPKETIAA